MNRDKFIPILLFLLLLLLILCTWCHTDKIVKNQDKLSSSAIKSSLNTTYSESINFNLSKSENLFELKGNFSTQKEVEQLYAALGFNDINNTIIINHNLKPNNEVIVLSQKLIPIFYNNYKSGSIRYEAEKIIIEGTVTKHAHKDAMSTLLANVTIPSVNRTIILQQEVKMKALTQRKTKEEAEEKAQQEKQQSLMKAKAEKIEAKIQKILDFEDINFELNQATLTQKSIHTLSQIANILKENPNVRVEIAGHTDNSGDDIHNLNLSQKRVNSVKRKLVKMTINMHRVNAVGYGESKPLVSNDTEENRRINRRVEFKILGE